MYGHSETKEILTGNKLNEIMVGKLITGEEIIAKVIAITQDYIKISKPLLLTLTEHPVTKEPSLLPLPWALSVDENEIIKIDCNKFIFISKPRKELYSTYLQIISNLIIPSNNIIQNKI